MSTRLRCDWCGRETAEFIVHDIVDDRGPAQIAWCTDAVACLAARKAAPPRATSQSVSVRS